MLGIQGSVAVITGGSGGIGMALAQKWLDDFQKVIDINLTGVFLTVRECSEQMINHGCKGLICLVSSTGSLGTAGQINYSSTKAAMSVMPKVITAEFFIHGGLRLGSRG